MKRKVQININNLQWQEGREEVNIFLEEEAVLHKKGNSYYFVYRDFSRGLAGARTVIKADPGKNEVMLQRYKPAEMHQTFNAGERIGGFYVTEAGKMTVETQTETVRLDLAPGEGRIFVDYQVYLSGKLVSQNELKINYFQKENDTGGK